MPRFTRIFRKSAFHQGVVRRGEYSEAHLRSNQLRKQCLDGNAVAEFDNLFKPFAIKCEASRITVCLSLLRALMQGMIGSLVWRHRLYPAIYRVFHNC